MTEYEYAVQWHYRGEERWYTLALRYRYLESAQADSNKIREHYDNMETRIVRRPKTESWEVVK